MELYEQFRYVAPYDWLINKNIQEWDMKQANISILRENNIISEDQYKYYLSLSKTQREIEIGILRKNPKVEETYKYGMIQAKKAFFSINNISNENVLYIDNDSVTLVYDWINDCNIDGNISNYITFRLNNRYTSFYRLQLIDFLYFNIGQQEHFRFKNIDDTKLKMLHKDHFLDLLLSIVYSAQNDTLEETIDLVTTIYKNYCNRDLDLNYYREFNRESNFKLFTTNYYIYYTNTIDESHRKDIDISYNASILRIFYKVYMAEYFNII